LPPQRLIQHREVAEQMASEPHNVTFETTVAASGNNTAIVVPDEVIGQLAAGKRPAVLVDLNGYQYRNTVGVMGGKHMISISAVRQATGLTARGSYPRQLDHCRRPA
jgi:Domain of unknown function (DUF1905)